MPTPTTLRGIAYPFRRGPQGFPAIVTGIEAVVANAIQVLLLTGAGERVMRTQLGTNVFAYVFETLDGLTQARIAASVARAIATYEPRAEVLSVEASAGDDRGLEETAIVVDIVYRINSQVVSLQVPVAAPSVGP